ncbi:MAG: hypothetical protein ACYC40_00695 [Patescibacteria group bacterium]
MRKIVVITLLCFCIFTLVGLKSSIKECASEAWMTENFGNRFISAKEVGLGELKSPFTEDELRHDKMSWIIPYDSAYHLIQFRYIKNTSEANDTLLLREAKKVVQVFLKTDRQFPNNEGIVFLKTRDIFSFNGTEYAKTIVLDKKGYRVIDLPTNVSIVIVGKQSNRYSYVSNILGGIAISINADDDLNIREELYGASVITPVELIPSQ